MFEVSQFIAAKMKAHKLVSATVLGYAVLALFHIPLKTFITLFDKNQAPQIFNILALATVFGMILILKAKRIPHSRPAFILGFALLGALFLSALLSGTLRSGFSDMHETFTSTSTTAWHIKFTGVGAVEQAMTAGDT